MWGEYEKMGKETNVSNDHTSSRIGEGRRKMALSNPLQAKLTYGRRTGKKVEDYNRAGKNGEDGIAGPR